MINHKIQAFTPPAPKSSKEGAREAEIRPRVSHRAMHHLQGALHRQCRGAEPRGSRAPQTQRAGLKRKAARHRPGRGALAPVTFRGWPPPRALGGSATQSARPSKTPDSRGRPGHGGGGGGGGARAASGGGVAERRGAWFTGRGVASGPGASRRVGAAPARRNPDRTSRRR